MPSKSWERISGGKKRLHKSSSFPRWRNIWIISPVFNLSPCSATDNSLYFTTRRYHSGNEMSLGWIHSHQDEGSTPASAAQPQELAGEELCEGRSQGNRLAWSVICYHVDHNPVLCSRTSPPHMNLQEYAAQQQGNCHYLFKRTMEDWSALLNHCKGHLPSWKRSYNEVHHVCWPRLLESY